MDGGNFCQLSRRDGGTASLNTPELAGAAVSRDFSGSIRVWPPAAWTGGLWAALYREHLAWGRTQGAAVANCIELAVAAGSLPRAFAVRECPRATDYLSGSGGSR